MTLHVIDIRLGGKADKPPTEKSSRRTLDAYDKCGLAERCAMIVRLHQEMMSRAKVKVLRWQDDEAKAAPPAAEAEQAEAAPPAAEAGQAKGASPAAEAEQVEAAPPPAQPWQA